MRLAPIMLCCLGALAAPAAEPWTTTDKTLAAAFWTTHMLDWAQTLDIERHPGLYETNPLLGKHPTRGQINRHFVAMGIAHLALEVYLPAKPRRIMESVTLGWQIRCVSGNYQLGLKATF